MIEHALVALALVLGLAGGFLLARSRLRRSHPDSVHRILLPFTGTEISRRALDAALRLARAENATLMPAYLAAVPLRLPLACALPNEAGRAMPMLEAIEQRAASQGVAVDARDRARALLPSRPRAPARGGAGGPRRRPRSGQRRRGPQRRRPRLAAARSPGGGAHPATGARPIRSAPAASSIAARAVGLIAVWLAKLWIRPGWRRSATRPPASRIRSA